MVRYAVRAAFSGARVLPVASRAGTSHRNVPTSLFVKVMIPESFKLQITE
jgi:hypothetical protein